MNLYDFKNKLLALWTEARDEFETNFPDGMDQEDYSKWSDTTKILLLGLGMEWDGSEFQYVFKYTEPLLEETLQTIFDRQVCDQHKDVELIANSFDIYYCPKCFEETSCAPSQADCFHNRKVVNGIGKTSCADCEYVFPPWFFAKCDHINQDINDRMQSVCSDCGEELGR